MPLSTVPLKRTLAASPVTEGYGISESRMVCSGEPSTLRVAPRPPAPA